MLGIHLFAYAGLVLQNWNGGISMLNNFSTTFHNLPSMTALLFISLSNFLVSLVAGLVYDGMKMNI